MSQQSNHYPETLPDPDDNDRFEETAIHAVYSAATDLAGLGWRVEDVAAIVARAFEKPAAVGPVIGPDPIPL